MKKLKERKFIVECKCEDTDTFGHTRWTEVDKRFATKESAKRFIIKNKAENLSRIVVEV